MSNALFVSHITPYFKAPIVVSACDIVRAENLLCKRVSVTVNSHDVLHVTGANGTGKTSFLLMLAGLLSVTNNEILWHNTAPNRWPRLYIGHAAGLNGSLTVAENIMFTTALSPSIFGVIQIQQINMALVAVGLDGYAPAAVATLSSGQKRRVMLALLWLCQQPVLWLLDEPFTALDAAMIAQLNDKIVAHAMHGGRVILTSHQPVQCATATLDLAEYRVNLAVDNTDDSADVADANVEIA